MGGLPVGGLGLDKRRVNIVKAGGVEAMLKLCSESTNEKTRLEAAKAVASLASCGERFEGRFRV